MDFELLPTDSGGFQVDFGAPQTDFELLQVNSEQMLLCPVSVPGRSR